MIKKILNNKWMLRSLIKTVYFNFHYLPFSQAIKLPIILYKPHFLKLKGRIIIQGNVRTGMITLGRNIVSIYPDTGINIENHGGTIIFQGHCLIGNNSSISVGEKSTVTIGSNFIATTTLRLISYHKISIDENVLCGWNCMFVDTDFHKLTLLPSRTCPPAFGEIEIGRDCWMAMNSTVMKNGKIGDYCVVAGNSIINKDFSEYTYCLLAGQPADVKKRGIFRDRNNDVVEY